MVCDLFAIYYSIRELALEALDITLRLIANKIRYSGVIISYLKLVRERMMFLVCAMI